MRWAFSHTVRTVCRKNLREKMYQKSHGSMYAISGPKVVKSGLKMIEMAPIETKSLQYNVWKKNSTLQEILAVPWDSKCIHETFSLAILVTFFIVCTWGFLANFQGFLYSKIFTQGLQKSFTVFEMEKGGFV